MTRGSGVGSHPGEDQHAFDEAVRVVLGELPDLPYLPEVPGRGTPAGMVGRTLAVLDGMGVDLQPAGWRVTDASGIDHRRAISLLAQDLDTFEEQTQGIATTVKHQLTGPWTLAASVERPRGDRVVADRGLRRDLAQSLASGLDAHLSDVRRRVGGAPLLVQVDEPALPAVLAGAVPTASGFHRHRSVDVAEAAETLGWVLEAVRAAGAEPVVHCCADGFPFEVLERVGPVGVSVDLDRLTPGEHDGLATALEADRRVLLGVVPSTRPTSVPTHRGVAERAARVLDMLGLEPTERLVLTPSCGLAGADPAWVTQALGLCATAARELDAG
jgi:methionine synthase II (cobalamin-independent)